MKLIDVCEFADAATYLYALLLEREESVNISHKSMPTPREHLAFVASRPYREWYLILDGEQHVCGAIYLTRTDEVGVFVFRDYQGRGIGPKAVKKIIKKHRGERLLANINPANDRSAEMFRRLGFEKIQDTYELGA